MAGDCDRTFGSCERTCGTCNGNTLPTAEIISGENARAFLVCGFLMKSFKKIYPENMKKIVGAVWELPAK